MKRRVKTSATIGAAALTAAICGCLQIAGLGGDYQSLSGDDPQGPQGACAESDLGDPCSGCTAALCCPELGACAVDPSCNDFVDCAAECVTDECMNGCISQQPSGYEVFWELWLCRSESCAAECA